MEIAHAATDVVRLTVPASLEYLRIARLTSSAVASRLGFDVDEIANLRVAIDELASLVVEASSDGPLELAFYAHDDELHIEGQAPAAPGTHVGIEDLTAQILKVVCDNYELRTSDHLVRFACMLRLP